MRNFAISLILLLTTSALAQEHDTQRMLQRLLEQSTTAYAEGRFEDFVDVQKIILAVDPENESAKYNMACGYALTGLKDEALEILRGQAERGVDMGASADPDFNSLWNDPEFMEIVDIFEEAYPAVSNSEIAYVLDRLDLSPEGLAYDPNTGRFFVSSMRLGTIYAVDQEGNWSEFASAREFKSYSLLGLKVDTVRNLVWAAAVAYNLRDSYDSKDLGKTAVLGFDLTTGERKELRQFPGSHPSLGYNDLVVAANGDIYCSGGIVFKVPADGSTPTEVMPSEVMHRSNGICLSADEETLFVSGQKMMAVNLSTGKWREINHPDSIRINRFDGLYYYNGCLVGIQRGAAPWRVIQLFLNDDETAVVSSNLIEQKHPQLTQAFTGTVVGDQLYYVGSGKPPETVPEGLTDLPLIQMGKTYILKAPLMAGPDGI